MRAVFLANLHHTFAQTDGTYAWPKGVVGDLLKQAKKEIEAQQPKNHSTDGCSNYFVEGATGWFVVRTKNKRTARSIGVREHGRGNVHCVRIASFEETKRFVAVKGEAALLEP